MLRLPQSDPNHLPLLSFPLRFPHLSYLVGYDEGGFAAASGLESFLHDFHLSDEEWTGTSSQLASRRALISSLGVLGAAVGAAVALAVMDSFGRLRTWQAFCILWLSGFAATTFASGSLDFLLVSRVWAGIGAGGLTVVAPLYLSEIAKAKARGMIVSIFMVFLLSSLMIGMGNPQDFVLG